MATGQSKRVTDGSGLEHIIITVRHALEQAKARLQGGPDALGRKRQAQCKERNLSEVTREEERLDQLGHARVEQADQTHAALVEPEDTAA